METLQAREKLIQDAYTYMAPHYDFLLNHVDYQYWYNYIKMIMQVYFGIAGSILEIGTGTGRFGAYFSRDGYNITGLDLSFEMLQVAKLRAYKNYSVVCGDARNLPFNGTFDFLFSVHDTLNYIVDIHDLNRVFQSVKNVMHKGSVFMFDLTTEYNVLTNFDSQVKHYKHDGWDIAWHNTYNKSERIIQSYMTFSKGGIFKEEIHQQRIYTTNEIVQLVKQNNFEIIELFADYSYEKPGPSTIMINFVIKRKNNRN